MKLGVQGYFTQPTTAVAILTGHGLKDPDRAIKTAGKLVEVGSNRDDLLRAIGL
jgi:threonine synthase